MIYITFDAPFKNLTTKEYIGLGVRDAMIFQDTCSFSVQGGWDDTSGRDYVLNVFWHNQQNIYGRRERFQQFTRNLY